MFSTKRTIPLAKSTIDNTTFFVSYDNGMSAWILTFNSEGQLLGTFASKDEEVQDKAANLVVKFCRDTYIQEDGQVAIVNLKERQTGNWNSFTVNW